jgi:Mg-chelatase subunit ChlD
MDIVCAKCGKHFSSVESAREHRGTCRADKQNNVAEPTGWSQRSQLSPEELERIINRVKTTNSKKTESQLFICPSCHNTSLSENAISGLYECLNLKCGKKFKKEHVTDKPSTNKLDPDPVNRQNLKSTTDDRIQVTSNSSQNQVSISNTGIEIKHQGKPIKGSADGPGYVYINIDCSSSMYGYKLQQAIKGTTNFAKDALNKNYLTGLIKFDEKATLVFEPCKDLALIESRLNTLEVGTTTNMEDAIYLSCSLMKDLNGPKTIVIVTDGMPNSPGDPQSSLKAGEFAKSQHIDIIAIGTDDADQTFLKELASRSELGIKVSSEKLEQIITSSVKLLQGNRLPEVKK